MFDKAGKHDAPTELLYFMIFLATNMPLLRSFYIFGD